MTTILIITIILIITYMVYPLWLKLFFPQVEEPDSAPTQVDNVSIVLLTCNGQTFLKNKIPFIQKEMEAYIHSELIIIDDSSTDGTREIIEQFAKHHKTTLIQKTNQKGIPDSMNMAVKFAKYEHIIFCDQRQNLAKGFIKNLLLPLGEENVGAVSACISNNDKQNLCSDFRKHENALKCIESKSGNLMGVYGPLYAIKKASYVELPENTILDDLYLSLQIMKNYKIKLAKDCLIVDENFSTLYDYNRTKRYIKGFLQILRSKSLMKGMSGVHIIMLFWHKILRTLIPLFLMLSYISIGIKGATNSLFIIPFLSFSLLLMILVIINGRWFHLRFINLIKLNMFYSIALIDLLVLGFLRGTFQR